MKNLLLTTTALAVLFLAGAAKGVHAENNKDIKITLEGSWNMDETPAVRTFTAKDHRRLFQQYQMRKRRELRSGSGGKKKKSKPDRGFIVSTDDDYSTYQFVLGKVLKFDGTTDETHMCNESTGTCHGAVAALVEGEVDEDDKDCVSITVAAGNIDGSYKYFRVTCPNLLMDGQFSFLGCLPVGQTGSCPVPATSAVTVKTDGFWIDFESQGPNGMEEWLAFVKITCCDIDIPSFLD